MPLFCELVIILKPDNKAEILWDFVAASNPKPLQKMCEFMQSFRFSKECIVHPSEHSSCSGPLILIAGNGLQKRGEFFGRFMSRHADVGDVVVIFI